MQDRKVFFAWFVVIGFLMKIAAEFIHEILGHGLFVLLFGGNIEAVHISILWPYELSYINWSFLISGITSEQLAWVYAGGILVCACISFLSQALLLMKRRISWYFSLALFWLAFWTLTNAAGYLIIGGLRPFGDVYDLIRLGVLTSSSSLAIGLVAFVLGFIALSWILRKVLIEFFTAKKASLGVILFWLIIPALVIVMWASPERNLQEAYVPLAFIPALLSFVIEHFLVLPKQRANKNPDNISKH